MQEDREALHRMAGRYEIRAAEARAGWVRAELVFVAADGTVTPTGHYAERKSSEDAMRKHVMADLEPMKCRYTDYKVRYSLRLEVVRVVDPIQGNVNAPMRAIPASQFH